MAFARMSGTATAPAYMASTCWNPRTASLLVGRTSSTGWAGRGVSFAACDTPHPPLWAWKRRAAPVRTGLALFVEPLGIPFGLHPHLHGARAGFQGGLDDLEHSLENLRAPAGEHRGLWSGFVGQARVACCPLRRLDLGLRRPFGLPRRDDRQFGAELGSLVSGHLGLAPFVEAADAGVSPAARLRRTVWGFRGEANDLLRLYGNAGEFLARGIAQGGDDGRGRGDRRRFAYA